MSKDERPSYEALLSAPQTAAVDLCSGVITPPDQPT